MTDNETGEMRARRARHELQGEAHRNAARAQTARLPTDRNALRTVAFVAIGQLSRRLLTESIEQCERIAASSAGMEQGAAWSEAARAFRAERTRRYGGSSV